MDEKANKQYQNLKLEYSSQYFASWSMSCAFQLTLPHDQFFIWPQLICYFGHQSCQTNDAGINSKCQSPYVCDLMFKGNFLFFTSTVIWIVDFISCSFLSAVQLPVPEDKETCAAKQVHSWILHNLDFSSWLLVTVLDTLSYIYGA